ncbi:hypothetical protein [Xenorhabdus littoralis]|uniref:hypothetical protein n=1 Tax=Xenorhabdus littoralis TaxID=2582835 RepID=UPI0029E7D4BF|nr:hypothetical protein [Xenorhabdus sp. psl]MDX7991701.1 hypothetical protein [Xenorhabdus sp. psl]
MENSFMLVIINHFDTEAPKQRIDILLNGIQTKFYFVENPVPDSIHITIPFYKISDGNYTVTYTVTDAANVGYSEPNYVKIINSGYTSMPYLSLTNKTNENSSGIISKNSVTATLNNSQKVDNVSLEFYIAMHIPKNPKLYTYITTSDGDWTPLIVLPATAKDGSYIIIQSNAEYYSYVSKSSKPSPDYLINTNNKYIFKYSFIGREWILCSNNKELPTGGDNVNYITPNDVASSAIFTSSGQYIVKSTDQHGQAVVEVTDSATEFVTVFAMLVGDTSIHDSIELNFVSDIK